MFYSFRDWAENKIFLELYSVDDISKHQPVDGFWEPDLSKDSDNYIYHFNVPGDNCGDSTKPCYEVDIDNNEYAAEIGFFRNEDYDDSGMWVQNEVFKGVLKAIGEFVDKKNPPAIIWHASAKSNENPVTGTVINPKAREHIYEKWALRHLFPDRYIPISASNWIRKDIYDSEYVPQGYPQVSDGITGSSSPAQKKIALNRMREEKKREEEEARKEEIRRREEEEARKQEEIRIKLQNPAYNPHNLKVNDLVDLSNTVDYRYRDGNTVGIIRAFFLSYNGVLYAGVNVAGQYYDREFKLKDLQPYRA